VDTSKVAFGKHLKKTRESRGFTQENLANDIEVEISQINRIERGEINTTISTLLVLAKALNIEVKYLFDFK
jgi:transcriptional regulator with XRE-family HTH domain